jgi:hypothetical protein
VQLPRSLSLGHAFQVAVDDRETVLLGQPGDLLVQGRKQIIRGCRPVRSSRDSHLSHLPFERAPPGQGGIGLDCDAMRDLVQPAPHGVSSPDCATLRDQDEEGRLKGILSIVRVAQDTPAYAQDHGSVPPHKRFESPGVVLGVETLEKLRVGEPRDHPLGEQSVDLPQGSP